MSKYHDLKYDSNVKQFQYLPYLYNITPEYIDEFNKNILKNKFGYYIDENNPKNYLQDKNRYINDNDRMLNYRRKYNENDILYETLTAEFYNMILYYNKRPYMRYDGESNIKSIQLFVKHVADKIIRLKDENPQDNENEDDHYSIPEYCIARPNKGGIKEQKERYLGIYHEYRKLPVKVKHKYYQHVVHLRERLERGN